ELVVFQGMVEWIYGEFIRKVSQGRKLDPAEVHRIAGGRVWSGREALKLGLVDELGGLDAAISHAAEIADIKNDYKLEEFPQSQTLSEMLASWFEKVRPIETRQHGVISQVIAEVEEHARELGQY